MLSEDRLRDFDLADRKHPLTYYFIEVLVFPQLPPVNETPKVTTSEAKKARLGLFFKERKRSGARFCCTFFESFACKISSRIF